MKVLHLSKHVYDILTLQKKLKHNYRLKKEPLNNAFLFMSLTK